MTPEDDTYPLGYFDDDGDDYGEPWCRDESSHVEAHRFCSDHQAMWCRLCGPHGCPQCQHDPHCPECHAALESENHDWDCSYAGDDDEE
jgi:hypothetical protein